MVKAFNKVCSRYNGRVLFKIKQTPGDRTVPRTSGGIYTRPIPEGYYMRCNAQPKKNPILKFFSRMIEEYKRIREAMKPDIANPFEDIKNIKGTTIEI